MTRKSLLGILGFAFAFASSTAVFAVGMGGINVGSALGQPLKAEIELTAVTNAEKASLVARLAPPDVYKDAGVEYPFGNKFRFQVESRANGEPYLKVDSELPVTDPFVIMLVELTWSAGKLVREYTFLLDPPGYVPDRPAPADVQAVAPAIQTTPVAPSVPSGGRVAPLEQRPEVVVSPITQTGEVEPAERAEQPEILPPEELPDLAEFLPPEKLPEMDEFIVIKRGDTMREVAERYRLSNMSLDRMLVALYRVNADHFDGRNMNRIKAGKVLRLPNQSEVETVSQSEAVKEIRAQTADWNLYRQKLASAASVRRQAEQAKQVATGRISSSVADKAPVAKETAKEVLRLSKGEAPGDGTATGAGRVASAQEKRDAGQEEAIARSKALKEEQDRIAMLEKQKQDLQRLEQLKAGLPEVKTQAAALAESAKPATPPAGTVSEVPTKGPAAVPTTEAPKPKSTPQPAPKQAEPEPLMDQVMSGLDSVLAEPLYLAAAALLLFGVGGLGFVRARQKKKPFHEAIGEPTEAGVAAVGAHLAQPVVPSPDTGDFTRMGEAGQAAAALESDHIDPIGEADLFLNFGRDAQAEEILKEALQKTPNDHRIQLKLLGIYSNRGDTNHFAAIARQLRDSGNAEAWQQAVAMGRKLDPNNPMYGGAGSVEDTGSATAVYAAAQPAAQVAEAAAPELDFNIDLGSLAAKPAPSPEEPLGGQGEVMSFDVTASEQAPAMDFNIGIEAPAIDLEVGAAPEVALPGAGEMIFDVGSIAVPPVAEPEAEKVPRAEEGIMEFTLDFPIEKPAEPAVSEAPIGGMDLAGISLHFDEEPAQLPSETGGKDEHWQEVATKLDLAKAYQEMGDAAGAREILEEVLREGDTEQRQAAQSLISQLG